ncbi:helix-turn-helix domain-containing protein [Streptomyces sp. ZYX-F-203]
MTTSCTTSPFGTLLQFHRIRGGFTQQQLADFAALSVRTIRDLEHGRVERPRQDTLRLLADALRLSSGSREAFLRSGRPQGPDWARPGEPSLPIAAYQPEPSAEHGPPGYEYATVHLAALSSDPADGNWDAALNDMAQQSWRLLAVDQGVAFLERALPTLAIQSNWPP